MLKVGLIGVGKVGRVGGTLVTLLSTNKDYKIVAVSDIDLDLAKRFAQTILGCRSCNSNQEVADSSNFVFIATGDDYIAPVCAGIRWRAGQSVVHVSGANLSDILDPAKKQGANTGVFHPNHLFSNPELDLQTLKGSTFDIEAEEPLLNILKGMATALDCHWVHVPAISRTAFYAAICLPSLYELSLIKLAVNLLQALNISKEQAVDLILHCVHETISLVERKGIDQNVPGPVGRGNPGTIEKVIRALEKTAPPLGSLYRELNLQTIPLALAQGTINQKQAAELEAVLKK
jgi:predicted short-subunit dehydrogenase-like oxidoreductase (DUF2520 family)